LPIRVLQFEGIPLDISETAWEFLGARRPDLYSNNIIRDAGHSLQNAFSVIARAK
jgi:hypothetical protein